jgi:cytoskeletal protein CcmA (bactofilin family)
MLWEKKMTSGRAVSDSRVSAPKVNRNGSDNASSPDQARSGKSVLGPSIKVKGELRGDEELFIEGQFEGRLQVQNQRITIGPRAKVKSDIQAREAVVEGGVVGNISAQQRIEIRETGHVAGDLVAPSIVIESGAYYKGKIEILTQETKEVAR